MTTLIFFCGHAGTGKTTLARRILLDLRRQYNWISCLLDKDTLYGDYSAAVMQVLTGDANDRDSPVYLDNLREPEYASLLKTARENLALGVNCMVVGPLSREIREHKLSDPAWLRLPDGVQLKIIWMYLQEAQARRRIEQRGNPNDAWKLAHWEQYHTRLFKPDPLEYPELIMYDNTAADAEQYTRLLEQLMQQA